MHSRSLQQKMLASWIAERQRSPLNENASRQCGSKNRSTRRAPHAKIPRPKFTNGRLRTLLPGRQCANDPRGRDGRVREKLAAGGAVEAISILPSLNVKTARLWRGIVPVTHLAWE